MVFCDLETERLWLRGIRREDRAFILKQFSNDLVNRYLFDAEPAKTIADADDIIDLFVVPEPRGQHRWILVRKSDGEKLGTCGFHCWDSNTSRCEIGYDLYPTYWKQGYMTEALRAIIAFSQTAMRVHRIDAEIAVDNAASARMAEKLGMAFRGETKDLTFRGERYPHRIYTLEQDV